MISRKSIAEYSKSGRLFSIYALSRCKGNGSSSLIILVFIVIVLAVFVFLAMYLIGNQSSNQQGSVTDNNINATGTQATTFPSTVSPSSDLKKSVSAGSFVFYDFDRLNVDFSISDSIFSIQKLDKDGKFSIQGDYVIKKGNNTVLRIPYLETDPVKVCEQLKSELGTDTFMSPNGYARPVMSQDGRRVYFSEPNTPNVVKVLQDNSDVSVAYTSSSGYVASIALDLNGDPYYTVVSASPFNCTTGRANNDIKLTHFLKGKTLTVDRYEELVAVGEGFIVTEFKPRLYFTSALGSVVIRNVSDGSIVNEFTRARILYRDSNYLLFIQSEDEMRSREKLIKLDLSNGKETILLDAWIENINVTSQNDLVIKYWEGFDFVNIKFTGKSDIYTYKLIQ